MHALPEAHRHAGPIRLRKRGKQTRLKTLFGSIQLHGPLKDGHADGHAIGDLIPDQTPIWVIMNLVIDLKTAVRWPWMEDWYIWREATGPIHVESECTPVIR